MEAKQENRVRQTKTARSRQTNSALTDVKDVK